MRPVRPHFAAEVVDYDPSWKTSFKQIRACVWPAVAAVAVAIEHVGSTAVEGLAAKPIIDVDVIVTESGAVPETMAALTGIGYLHEGDLGIAGREAFAQPDHLPEHHLYVVIEGSQPLRDHLDFRDYLRSHPEQAKRYAAEKRRLAHLLSSDREAYVSGKAWLVREILAAARAK